MIYKMAARRFSRQVIFISSILIILTISSLAIVTFGHETFMRDINPHLVLAESNTIPQNIYFPIILNPYKDGQIPEWKPWGLMDKDVREVVISQDKDCIWVLTTDGLFKSTTYGNSWERIDSELPNPPAHFVVEENHHSDPTIFAATVYPAKVFISSDGGNSWREDADFGWEAFSFIKIIDGEVYAQISFKCLLWKREKSGDWQLFDEQLDFCFNDMVSYQSFLYAGSQRGLYKFDHQTWQPVNYLVYDNFQNPQTIINIPDLKLQFNFPLIRDVSNGAVHSLFVQADLLFISAEPRGLYKTIDGDNWVACDVGLTNAYYQEIRKMVMSSNGLIFAAALDGVFMTENQGERWQALDMGLPKNTTGYGVLLDNMNALDVFLLRDEGNELIIGAVFNDEGIRSLHIINQTRLKDQPPQTPPKAVLVVGPVDPPEHNGTKSFIAWAERLAVIMENNGVNVVRLYWPDSHWANVREEIGNASIVVYKGHGFGVGDDTADPTEMHGGVNGFCLGQVEAPSEAFLATQDMLIATNRVAENAIGFFFCCSCAGASAVDDSPVSIEFAKKRIEAYSSTILRMGGGAYFSGVDEERFLRNLFANPTKSIGEIYQMTGGAPQHIFSHILWPEKNVWFDGPNWGRAFVGNPNLTANDILGIVAEP